MIYCVHRVLVICHLRRWPVEVHFLCWKFKLLFVLKIRCWIWLLLLKIYLCTHVQYCFVLLLQLTTANLALKLLPFLFGWWVLLFHTHTHKLQWCSEVCLLVRRDQLVKRKERREKRAHGLLIVVLLLTAVFRVDIAHTQLPNKTQLKVSAHWFMVISSGQI